MPYPNVAGKYERVDTEPTVLLEVEAKDPSTIFKAAIQHLENEINKTISEAERVSKIPVKIRRVGVANFPLVDEQHQARQQEELNSLYSKRADLKKLQEAVRALQVAVKADTQLPPEEAIRIAQSTKNLVEVAVSPSVTWVQLNKAIHDFKNVTSPLNKTNIVLAKLCLAVCVAAVVVAFVVFPCLFGLALISKGLFMGLTLGSCVSFGVALNWGLSPNDSKSRPRFFQPRTMVEQAAEHVASFTFNSNTFRR